MKAPINIAEIAERYEILKKEYHRIEQEMDACRKAFMEWKGDTGVYVGHLFIADEPNGNELNDGEYCDQWRHGADWYTGTYYYPIEGSNKYLAYTYESSIINYQFDFVVDKVKSDVKRGCLTVKGELMNPYLEEAIEYLESFDVAVSKHSIRRILEEWISNCNSHIGLEAHEHERACGIIDMTGMSWEEQDDQMREQIRNYENALVELEQLDM